MYWLILWFVAVVRELFGFGEILGMRVIPLSWYATQSNPDAYQNIGLMLNPPAAFFIIGLLIGLSNWANKQEGQ